MPAILRIKDKNGKIYPIPAIRGERGNAVETGGYTGNGTFGAENPTRLTFPFTPKLLCISKENPSGEFLFWMEGIPCFLRVGNINGENGAEITVSENTAAFHAETAAAQYNETDVRYRYIAWS